MNSKTQLGAIVLAFRLLRTLSIPAPRLISQAAARLELSRKTGYQSAREIEARLTEPLDLGDDGRHELVHSRLKIQVLQFQLDSGIRFSKRKGHLPKSARSFCVRVFRDFRAELSENEIADAIGVPLSNLRRWEAETDADCQFPDKPENRGRHRGPSDEDIELVLSEHEKLERKLPIAEFTQHLASKRPDQAPTLSEQAVLRILGSQGLIPAKAPTPHSDLPRYHGEFKVYHPGAQFALDAKKTTITFSSQPRDPITVTQEIAVDLASGAIVGEALGKEETAEGVSRATVQACRESQTALASLADNRSANKSGQVERVAERDDLFQIFTYPGHPQTNGHLEGLFGWFSRRVGEITIDDSSKETLAMSIAALIWRIYIRFHNFSPRKRLKGQNPIEYLRRYTPSSAEVEEAREGLRKQRDRSRRLRQKHPRLTDPGFRELVDGIITRHRFEVELDKAIKALLNFDESVIRNSDTAFHVASQRDAFQEDKRSFAYFMGIVRNKQKQIDGERAKEKVQYENSERRRAHERAMAKEREAEERELEIDPESFILRWARLLLIGKLQLLRGRFTEELRRGIGRLRELGRATKSVLGKLSFTIRSWPDFSEDLKSRMVELLAEEFASERQPIAAASTEEPREPPTPSETCEITEQSKQELMDMLSGLYRMPP